MPEVGRESHDLEIRLGSYSEVSAGWLLPYKHPKRKCQLYMLSFCLIVSAAHGYTMAAPVEVHDRNGPPGQTALKDLMKVSLFIAGKTSSVRMVILSPPLAMLSGMVGADRCLCCLLQPAVEPVTSMLPSQQLDWSSQAPARGSANGWSF